MELLSAIQCFYDVFVAPFGSRTRHLGITWETLHVHGEKVKYFYAENGVYVFDRGFDTFTVSRGPSAAEAWQRASY